VSYDRTINVELNLVAYGLPIGTTLVIKWGAIFSGNGTINWSWNVRT
jgi:hypothetical protein